MRTRPLTSPVAVAVAASVAAVTAFVGLGNQPLSWDEAVTLNAARRPAPALWDLLRHTDAPLGLYYAAMHVWLRAGDVLGIGDVAWWMRVPSALATVAAVALTVAIVAAAYRPVPALIAGVLLATHPLVVFYAHDARPYATAMLLAVVAAGVMGLDLRRPRPVLLAAFGTIALVNVFLQFWTILSLAACVLYAATRGRRPRYRYGAVAAIVVLAAVPLVIISRRETGEVGWISAPTVRSVAGFAARICGGGPELVIIIGVLALLAWQRRAAVNRPGAAGLAVLLAALVPPAALIGLSFWQPMMVPRYAIASVPFIVVGAVLLAARLPRHHATVVYAVLIASGIALTVAQTGQPYKYEDFRGAAAMIVHTAQPGDGLLYVPSSSRVGLVPYLDGDRHTGVVPVDLALTSPTSLRDGAMIGGAERACLAEPARVYLVGSSLQAAGHDPSAATIVKVADLRDRYVVRWQRRYGDVLVTLFVRRGSDQSPSCGPGRRQASIDTSSRSGIASGWMSVRTTVT
jgi:mannosyltransferase